MFQFTLVKNLPFQTSSPGTWNGNYYREIYTSAVRIGWEDKSECKELSELKELVEGYRATKLGWNLKVQIIFDTTRNSIPKPKDFIRIYVTAAEKSCDALAGLKEVLGSRGWHLKMSAEIKDFGCSRGDGDKVHVGTAEEAEGIIESSRGGLVRFESDLLRYSGILKRSLWKQRIFYTGVITVNCIVYRSKDYVPKMKEPFPGSGPLSGRIVQRMLGEGLFSDATIITAEGEEIKCHQFILKEHSDAFETMLKDTSSSTLSIPGFIKMDDMCSKSVKALLAYLYLEDIGQAAGDCGVAFDLLQAARKYLVPKLEKKMKQILSCKPNEWFDVEVAMRLYLFVKNLEYAEELKLKALHIMKKNYAALNELPAYIQLFEKEPHAARQLSADLVGMK